MASVSHDGKPRKAARNKPSAARKRRMATAYHEAGHVVACYVLKQRFKYATIEPGEDSLGHVLETRLPTSFQPDMDKGPRARTVAEKRILSLFAGEAAEARWRGKHNWQGAAADFESVTNLTTYLCGGPKEEQAYIRWLALRAQNMVCCYPNWCLVEVVAMALLERNRLTYAEARRIMRESVAAAIRKASETRARSALDAAPDRADHSPP